MAVTGQQVFNTLLFDILEDPPTGPLLGIITTQQFIDMLNLVILEFLKRGGLLQRIYTQSVFSGINQYTIPSDIVDIQSVWLAGRWLPASTQMDLNSQIRNWRITQDTPRFYYLDGLPLSTIGLAPTPNYNGEFILGPNEPDPPHSVYDSFSAICQVGTSQILQNPVQHRGLTIIGTQKNVTSVVSITDPVPLVPDDFALASLHWGVEYRLFSGDNELHDEQCAAFAKAQFEEQINICRAITGQLGMDEGEALQ
jgi:hypothetical protein